MPTCKFCENEATKTCERCNTDLCSAWTCTYQAGGFDLLCMICCDEVNQEEEDDDEE